MLSAPPPPAPPRRRGPLLTAVALVVVVAGVAVWALVALVSANGDLADAERDRSAAESRLAEVRADDDIAFTRARDEVTAAARDAVVVLNTLDHRELDEGLAAWAEVTTGALHEEVTGLPAESRQQLLDAQSVTSAEMLAVAVRELDERAGTATVLTSVKLSVTIRDDRQPVRYDRGRTTLTRTDDGWKVDSMSSVPYAEPGS